MRPVLPAQNNKNKNNMGTYVSVVSKTTLRDISGVPNVLKGKTDCTSVVTLKPSGYYLEAYRRPGPTLAYFFPFKLFFPPTLAPGGGGR